VSTLDEQLWAANAEVRRLQDAIAAKRAAELQARVDGMRADIERHPDPHVLLTWIQDQMWADDAEWLRGALAQLVNDYFVALDERQVTA